MSDDENVIELPKTNEVQFSVIEDKGYCQHNVIELDEKNRTVSCDRCGASLDPFNWLLEKAEKEISILRQHSWRQRDLKNLGEKIHELQKEEKRIKARIRTAKKRLGE